jgi:hypothetical protein
MRKVARNDAQERTGGTDEPNANLLDTHYGLRAKGKRTRLLNRFRGVTFRIL